jgi:hypothetical protein
VLRVLSAALLLAACAPPEPCTAAPLRQDEVLDLVWSGVLGEEAAAPRIEWVRGEPCKGLRDAAIPLGDTCAAGIYTRGLVRLVIPSHAPRLDRGFGPFSSSAIVHELVHAHMDRATGDPDSRHKVAPWWIVQPVNDMLLADGL